MSEMVARTGWPCSPKTSHSVVGQDCGDGWLDAPLCQDGGQFGRHAAHLRDAGQVALDVRQEDGHTQVRQTLGQALQGDGLARARGTGDQAVAVGQSGQQVALGVFVPGNQDGVGHGAETPQQSKKVGLRSAFVRAIGPHDRGQARSQVKSQYRPACAGA
jgi:hypothetical protein